jgi:N-acyl-D-amino-acid deacylase
MYDLIIKGGRVADGTGSPAFRADVGIANGRIISIGPLGQARVKRVLDAAGHLVCPGFIDVHSHADLALLREPQHKPKIMQGVTTEIFSNCGIGFAPALDGALPLLLNQFGPITGPCPNLPACASIHDYLSLYEGKTACNIAYLISHGALRISVCGVENRQATRAELERMCALLEDGLQDGSFGLSTGLFYVPMRYSPTEELEALCRVVAEAGGIVATHVRNYYQQLIESHEEVLSIAEVTGVRLQLSHLVAPGKDNWGKGRQLAAMVRQGRERGIDVTCDCYPYLAGSSSLSMFLPPEILAGGRDAAVQRLQDPSLRTGIYEHLRKFPFEWSEVYLCGLRSQRNQRISGRTLARVAQERGLDVLQLICDLLLEEDLEVSFLVHQCQEQDLEEVLRLPEQMVGSDGLHVGTHPHPRLYGCFPRFLCRYVREKHFFTWEQAIQKMTGLPANRFGLQDRGILRVGMAADLVVLDPSVIADTATYEAPCQYPLGIPYVICNGVLVKDEDQPTGALPGQILRFARPAIRN